MTEKEREELGKVRTLAEVASTTHIDRNTIFAAIKRGDVGARQSSTTWLMTFESICKWVNGSINRKYLKNEMNPEFVKKYSKFI